jgi:hypothetical protein
MNIIGSNAQGTGQSNAGRFLVGHDGGTDAIAAHGTLVRLADIRLNDLQS